MLVGLPLVYVLFCGRISKSNNHSECLWEFFGTYLR